MKTHNCYQMNCCCPGEVVLQLKSSGSLLVFLQWPLLAEPNTKHTNKGEVCNVPAPVSQKGTQLGGLKPRDHSSITWIVQRSCFLATLIHLNAKIKRLCFRFQHSQQVAQSKAQFCYFYPQVIATCALSVFTRGVVDCMQDIAVHYIIFEILTSIIISVLYTIPLFIPVNSVWPL